MDSAWAFDCRNTSRSRGPTPLTRLHLSPPSPPIRPFCVALYSALRHLAGHRPNHSGGSLARPARARPRRGEHVCRRVLVLSFFLSFFLFLSFSLFLPFFLSFFRFLSRSFSHFLSFSLFPSLSFPFPSLSLFIVSYGHTEACKPRPFPASSLIFGLSAYVAVRFWGMPLQVSTWADEFHVATDNVTNHTLATQAYGNFNIVAGPSLTDLSAPCPPPPLHAV